MSGKGDHRLGRKLLIAVGAAATIFVGAWIFETPARDKVTRAFRKAAPDIPEADLVIVEAGPRTYRTAWRGGRRLSSWETKREVATTLWCARDRRRPERRMAAEYHRSAIPLVSGPRTLARSWVLGRGVTADNILAECARNPASGPPALT